MSTERVLRIGTRGSALARRQTEMVAQRLRMMGLVTQEVIIRTHGDHFHQPLYGMGVKGVFVKEIEEALLANDIDVAVHSAKDLPTELPEGLTVGACLPRDVPWDAWVSSAGTLESIVAGARVGTSSLRRMAMIRHCRPDLELLPIRGNVDTRLRKLEAGEYDAVVMAAAGLERMGWSDRIVQVLRPPDFVPAAGQGVIVVEIREDSPWRPWVEQINDRPTELALQTERRVVRLLGGGCHAPAGVYAEARSIGDSVGAYVIHVVARLWTQDGVQSLGAEAVSPSPEAAADEVVRRLRAEPAFRHWQEAIDA
ncbi:MAG: hydroxymethylbilane synthase [Acidobacteria bacterium]|nr:hydroxymethylbilane synthase [Acidobacteriota bacterium]MDW7984725.1 hydroxymethylbilane synthase [Acidobacteriota bacterium]